MTAEELERKLDRNEKNNRKKKKKKKTDYDNEVRNFHLGNFVTLSEEKYKRRSDIIRRH